MFVLQFNGDFFGMLSDCLDALVYYDFENVERVFKKNVCVSSRFYLQIFPGTDRYLDCHSAF
jgi:hypothetical protein